LVVHLAGVGKQYPLSMEKLSPVLAFYIEDGWQKGCDRCIELLNFGGRGHSLAIHANDKEVVMQFALKKPAFRIIVNSPAAIGAVGYTTELDPSMTLGCGSYGGNITSDNIGPVHLMNIKRVAWETKPLSMPRETGAWRPTLPASTTRAAEFPYQKALSSDVSRKGGSVKPMPAPADKPWLSGRESAEKKYGTGKMSGEQVDKLVSEFVKTRRR
jgi:acetaldehyde dehydrogenase (acetylating)